MQCICYPFVFFLLLQQYGEPGFGCEEVSDNSSFIAYDESEDDVECIGGFPRYVVPIIVAAVLALRKS